MEWFWLQLIYLIKLHETFFEFIDRRIQTKNGQKRINYFIWFSILKTGDEKDLWTSAFRKHVFTVKVRLDWKNVISAWKMHEIYSNHFCEIMGTYTLYTLDFIIKIGRHMSLAYKNTPKNYRIYCTIENIENVLNVNDTQKIIFMHGSYVLAHFRIHVNIYVCDKIEHWNVTHTMINSFKTYITELFTTIFNKKIKWIWILYNKKNGISIMWCVQEMIKFFETTYYS